MRRWLAVLLVLLPGCAPAGGATDAIVVAAASDLAAALPALLQAFEEESGYRVVASLGSSGQIANQVLHGAPIDVFLSADRGWVDRLEEAGRLDPAADRVLYAYGLLVLLSPAGRTPLADVDALRDDGIRRIAIANPEHAPYGVAARQVLTRAGLWDALQPRLIIAENVRQAQQFAETGSVDVALTARSLVSVDADSWVLIPDSLHAPLAQTGAAMSGRPDSVAARAFLRFMAGPAARDILARAGFLLPEQ
jgi:molybdate transport system substrate-binding protein